MRVGVVCGGILGILGLELSVYVGAGCGGILGILWLGLSGICGGWAWTD